MSAVKIVVWAEDGGWLGYLQNYPDYWTQGDTLEDLKEHLKDLYADVRGTNFLASGGRQPPDCSKYQRVDVSNARSKLDSRY
jgi:predicted RNase H-like HicB family nuclease